MIISKLLNIPVSVNQMVRDLRFLFRLLNLGQGELQHLGVVRREHLLYLFGGLQLLLELLQFLVLLPLGLFVPDKK